MGGPEKALHQQRRTNDERRTTWTIIIPRQNSQNPRANNIHLSFSFTENDTCFFYVYTNYMTSTLLCLLTWSGPF